MCSNISTSLPMCLGSDVIIMTSTIEFFAQILEHCPDSLDMMVSIPGHMGSDSDTSLHLPLFHGKSGNPTSAA